MSRSFELVPASLDERWDDFVTASPHGTPYALGAFLRGIRDVPLAWYCRTGKETVAALLLTRGEDADTARRSDLLVYHGILGAPHDGASNDADVVLQQFDVAEFLVSEMARRFAFVSLQLSPQYIDVRPFLWHNYGTGGPTFSVDVRYTTYIDITDVDTEEARALDGMRRARRREVRDARDEGLVTHELFDAALCAELYRQTMERQGIVVDADALDEMRCVMTSLHAAQRGRMFVCADGDGEPLSAVFMGVDPKRAYGMFGGSDPRARSGAAGTAVLWDAFRALSRSGVDEVDLEGVNSPRRGWFKLSFGGTLLPYYSLTLDQRGVFRG